MSDMKKIKDSKSEREKMLLRVRQFNKIAQQPTKPAGEVEDVLAKKVKETTAGDEAKIEKIIKDTLAK